MIRQAAHVLTGLVCLLLTLAATACAGRSPATTTQSLTVAVIEDARGTTVTVVRRRESAHSDPGSVHVETTEETLPTVLIPVGERQGSVRLSSQFEYQLLSAVKTAEGITVTLTEGDRK